MTELPQTQYVDVDPSQEPAVRTLAAAHGVEVEQVPHRGIEPVTTVTLALVGTAAAVATVLHVLDQRKGGQVIDLRPGTPKAFYRTRDLLYGIVVIIAVDGTVTVNVKKPDGMFSTVTSVLPQLLSACGSAEQAVKVVTETLGADVEIGTDETPPPGGDV